MLGALFDDATGLDTSSGAGFWIWIVLGWLVGASWAEYRLTRPFSVAQSASLMPREVLDYLPARLYAAPAVAAGVAVVLAAIGLLAPDPATPPAHPLPPTAGLVLGATGAIVIALLIRLAVRAVVARRQPTSPADVVAADDAIRASAVHNLAGGGTAAILLIASQLAFSVFAPRDHGVGGISILAFGAARPGGVRGVALVGLSLLARSPERGRRPGPVVIIRLDPDSAVPPYAQLHDQLGTMIRSGVLAPGARLPAIRHLANDLGVAVNTVGRAYRELEIDGLVASRGRHGTTVLEPVTNAPTRRAEVATAATSYALEARHRGLDLDQALAAVRSAFVHLDQRGAS